MSKYVREVDSIQALRSTTTSDAAAAHVRTPTGRSGVFVPLDADPFGNGDDAAVALRASDGTWWARKKALDGIADPRWWGAVLDGSTDDTSALRSAIDFLSPGDRWILEGGVALVSSELIFDTTETTIHVKEGAHIKVDAAGWSGTGDEPVVKFRADNLTIPRVEVDGNGHDNTLIGLGNTTADNRQTYENWDVGSLVARNRNGGSGSDLSQITVVSLISSQIDKVHSINSDDKGIVFADAKDVQVGSIYTENTAESGLYVGETNYDDTGDVQTVGLDISQARIKYGGVNTVKLSRGASQINIGTLDLTLDSNVRDTAAFGLLVDGVRELNIETINVNAVAYSGETIKIRTHAITKNESKDIYLGTVKEKRVNGASAGDDTILIDQKQDNSTIKNIVIGDVIVKDGSGNMRGVQITNQNNTGGKIKDIYVDNVVVVDGDRCFGATFVGASAPENVGYGTLGPVGSTEGGSVAKDVSITNAIQRAPSSLPPDTEMPQSSIAFAVEKDDGTVAKKIKDESGTVTTEKQLRNSATIDFGNINAHSAKEDSITVGDAAIGDHSSVSVADGSFIAEGIILFSFINASSQVRIRAVNTTASSITMDPVKLSAAVFKAQ